MKKGLMIFAAFILASGLFAQNSLKSGRELYVGVWKFAGENGADKVKNYNSQIKEFLAEENLSASLGKYSSKTSSSQKAGMVNKNKIDLGSDEYTILTSQISKGLVGNTLNIFCWNITNENGTVKVKLCDGLTSLVDANGNMTSSKFLKSKIMNKSQLETYVLNSILNYANASDSEYEAYKKEVVSDGDFLLCVIPDMTDLELDTFIEENDLYNVDSKFSFEVVEVRKNDITKPGLTAEEYAYRIYGTVTGDALLDITYFNGLSNSTVFNKAKKGSYVTYTGKIKLIVKKGTGTGIVIYFAVE